MRGNFSKMGGAGRKNIRRAAAAVCELLENRQMLDVDSYTYLGVITTTVNEGQIYQARINCMNLSPGHSLTASYSLIPGTADSSDYGVTSGTVTLTGNGAYSASQIIYIPILADNVVEGSVMQSNGILVKGTETFTLRLTSVSEGNLGYPSPPESRIQYTITIVDDPPIVSIAAGDADAMENAEGEDPNPGSVLVERYGGNFAEALMVFLSPSGTATYSTDYNMPNMVTIPAGSPTETAELTVRDDTEAEGIETAEVRVSPNPGVYLLMDPTGASPAVVNIDDNVSVSNITVSVRDLTQTFDGYDFKVPVEVTGEKLNQVEIHQLVQGSTSLQDYGGNPLTPAEMKAYFPNADDNVFYPQGDWAQDTGWTWSPLIPISGSKNGHAIIDTPYGDHTVDHQWLTLATDSVPRPGGGQTLVSYLCYVTRYYRLETRKIGTTSVNKSLDWGYSWSNYNCSWTLAEGSPHESCAAQFKGFGEFLGVQPPGLL